MNASAGSLRLSSDHWDQINTAYLAGAELRGLARSLGIAEGTILARASRERWSTLREEAMALSRPPQESLGVPIAQEAGSRADRHVRRMERLTDKIGSTVDGLDPDLALQRIRQLDTFDKLTRRTLGLPTGEGANCLVQLNALVAELD